jgi:branched-chain amino acid transport system ATP-binding protein
VRALLELSGLSAGYGGVPVVREITLTVAPGEVVGLLGPNGAGKTTTLLSAMGVLPVLDGDVVFDGRSIRHLPPHRIAQSGLALVPEERGVIRQLTVGENLDLARRSRRSRPVREVMAVFPALDRLLSKRAGLISGGEQQMLALAKALLPRPRLLMVDELSHGLAPALVEKLFPAVRQLAADDGTAILLVEQLVDQALEFSDRVYVLHRGRVTLEGRSDELRSQKDVFESIYLGHRRE